MTSSIPRPGKVSMPNMPSCAATTRSGAPCAAPPVHGEPFCVHHHPDMAEVRDAARVAGGQVRAGQLRRVREPTASSASDPPPSWWSLNSTSEARAALAFVAQEVLSGRLAARDANAATQTISAIVNVLREADLERRLDVIEVALGCARSGRR